VVTFRFMTRVTGSVMLHQDRSDRPTIFFEPYELSDLLLRVQGFPSSLILGRFAKNVARDTMLNNVTYHELNHDRTQFPIFSSNGYTIIDISRQANNLSLL
jgi:hypothetical protein